MDWTHYVHHDHTPFFTSALEAAVGDTITLRLRVPKSAPINAVTLAYLEIGELQRKPMKLLTLESTQWAYFETELTLTARTTRYTFWIHASEQTVKLSARGVQRINPAFRDWFVFTADHHRPNWLDDRVFYQIFPDRFYNGDPSNDVQDDEYSYNGKSVKRMAWNELPTKNGNVSQHWGGDLEGIRQKLPYLEDLGINGLYLTPIFTSPSNHRYDTQNYLEIDPHLGGQAAFDALIKDAKARGFRVILDGVFNHSGDGIEEFKRARDNQVERELYTFRSDGNYEAFFGVKTLPKLDYDSRLAFEHFIEGPHAPVRHWLRSGADGWRLDVAQMIGKGGTDRGNLEIHRRIRNAARLENPEAWIFGERFLDHEPYLQGASEPLEHDGGGEDGSMNYQGFGLPVTDWLSGIDVWGQPLAMPTEELAQTLEETYRVVPPLNRFSHYNLLGSHDTSRILERLGGDIKRLQTAFALLLSFPGIPGIYYGDEIGLMGGSDPFCRAPFPWEENQWNQGLRSTVQRLIRARKTSIALQKGHLKILETRGHAIAFARAYTHADARVETAIITVTRGKAEIMVLNVALVGVMSGTWRDALTDELFQAEDGLLKVTAANPRVLVQI